MVAAARGEKRQHEEQGDSGKKKPRAKAKAKANAKTKVTQPASAQSGEPGGPEPADAKTDDAVGGVAPSGEGGDDKPVPERKTRKPTDTEVMKNARSEKDRVIDDIPPICFSKMFWASSNWDGKLNQHERS